MRIQFSFYLYTNVGPGTNKKGRREKNNKITTVEWALHFRYFADSSGKVFFDLWHKAFVHFTV
jgi:hypothetical protein